MKKTLISLTLAAAGFVALAAPAGAHIPKVSHACTEKGAALTVVLTQYEKGSTVTVNGVKSVFGTADYDTTVTLGDGTKPVTWTVTVDNKGDGKHDQWDQTFTDTVEACVTPPPTTTAPLETKDLTPAPAPATTVDYCADLRAYFTANPDAPRTNGWDVKCAPVVVDAPAVISTQVLDRAPIEAPPVLAFTGSETTERAKTAGIIILIGVACMIIGRPFHKKANA